MFLSLMIISSVIKPSYKHQNAIKQLQKKVTSAEEKRSRWKEKAEKTASKQPVQPP